MPNKYPVDCPPKDVPMKFKTRRCPADDPLDGLSVDFLLLVLQYMVLPVGIL